MGKTIEVAADRQYDESKTVLPAEMARGVYLQNAPRLQALKIMHLMISRAGGRMADDTRHTMRLSDIRSIDGLGNHDRSSLMPLFSELASAVLIIDDPAKQVMTIGGLLDEAQIDYCDEADGDLAIEWTFRSTFRRLARDSNHWAILDRQTVFHLGSKYSVLLFQHVASLVNLDYTNAKTFTVADLRSVLGIPEGRQKRFADLNRNCLQPAILEINQLSRFNLSAQINKVGRRAVSVTIKWEPKPDPSEAKRELARPKTGRTARRTGTVETVASATKPIFPATGGISYSPDWLAVKRRTNCNYDNELLAQDFRGFCATKGIPLDSANIEKTFEGFCRKKGRV